MIGVGDAIITEIVQGLNITAPAVGVMNGAGSTFLCHSCVEEASLLKGQTQVCVLWQCCSINYLAPYLCVPSISTEVFFKGIFQGLSIKLCKLRGKSPEHIKIEHGRRW